MAPALSAHLQRRAQATHLSICSTSRHVASVAQPVRGSAQLARAAAVVTSEVTSTEAVPAPRPVRTFGRELPDGSILFSAAELLGNSITQPAESSISAQPAVAATQPSTSAPPAQPAPAPAAPKQANSAARPAPAAVSDTGIDWAVRRRRVVVQEILDAAARLNRGPVRKGFRPMQSTAASGGNQLYDAKKIEAGLKQLETLLPGFQPNLDMLPATQWAKLALDVEGVAARLVALKAAWPGADLSALLTQFPKALMFTPEEIAVEGAKVREMLKNANNPCAIIQAIPEMLVTKNAASIIITVNKWYGYQRDPVEVLEKDPELVQRAQANEEPFEPVWFDETMNQWVVPGAKKINKPQWAQEVEQMQRKQGAQRQEKLKAQLERRRKSRDGEGTTAFVTKSFEPE